jgi:hypothetical protein
MPEMGWRAWEHRGRTQMAIMAQIEGELPVCAMFRRRLGGVTVRRIIVKSILLALIVSSVCVRPAMAYIDPNTGGVLFQVLAAAFALLSGVALIFSRQIRVAFARSMRYLRGLFSRGSGQVQDAQEHPQDDEVGEGVG